MSLSPRMSAQVEKLAMHWPEWWSWDLELTPHLMKRMVDRQFNEVDLRLMLDDAIGYHENEEEGRFVIQTKHEGREWEVIVEPAHDERALVVVTAYSLD